MFSHFSEKKKTSDKIVKESSLCKDPICCSYFILLMIVLVMEFSSSSTSSCTSSDVFIKICVHLQKYGLQVDTYSFSPLGKYLMPQKLTPPNCCWPHDKCPNLSLLRSNYSMHHINTMYSIYFSFKSAYIMGTNLFILAAHLNVYIMYLWLLIDMIVLWITTRANTLYCMWKPTAQ